jgi:glycosyltransferase involved in cell wall biosynthesis
MDASKTPMVSVITCFYKEEKFLEETIQSVVRQSYTHWELILVDDGSPDSSPDIALRYAKEYPGKIIYLQHKNHANKGVCKSRNLGIAHARGEYIAYLDADDVWLATKLENQLNLFDKLPQATVLMEASLYWYSWQGNNRQDVVIEIGAAQNQLYTPPALMLQLYPLGPGAAPCPSGMVVKRRVHDHISFVEDFIGDTAVYEDQAFLAQIYLNENVYISSAHNNLYRQRPASQVFNVHQDGRYHSVRQYYLEWLKRYLDQYPERDERIDKLLKKALMPYDYPYTFAVLYTLPSKIKNKIRRIMKRILNS